MRDTCIAYHRHDQPEARGLADTLTGRGIELARPVELGPGDRLLKRVDHGLYEARFAVVLVTPGFLKVAWLAKELDGLAGRERVVSLLYGVDEEDVARHSRKLAMSAIPGSMVEHLVRLLRSGPTAGTNGRFPHP